jgi:hypothetical protein
MFCESYREALKEAALTGEQLPARLEAHLHACVSCRAAFSEELALFERIGAKVGARVNAEVPASLLLSVRQEIAASPAGRTWRLPVLAYLASGLAIVAIALTFAVRSKVSVKPEPSAHRISPPAANEPIASQKESGSRPVLVANSKRNRRLLQVAVHAEPEVLVSAEEQLGLRRYAASLRKTKAEVPVIKVNASAEIEPLQIASVDVKGLSIDPLQSGDSD